MRLSPRIIPVVLASAAFVVTFAWQGGFRRGGEAAAYATVSAPLDSAAMRRTSIPTTHRPNTASTPRARPAIALTNTADLQTERAREENHSSRMR